LTSTDTHPILEVRGITKSFPSVLALDNVCMELYEGKVTAVIGENGAGKSTLMKVLSGIYQDYEGDIMYNQQSAQFTNPKDAQDAGIAIIHQELNLIPFLSVRENIYLGREITTKLGILDKEEMNLRTGNILKKLKLDISPDTLISKLKVGQQQIVEIAKALLFEAKIIIMDEPTSAISESEVDVLFELIEELKEGGKAIAYISHKLDELTRISDYYIVLRDGKLVAAGKMKGIANRDIIQKMVGREVKLMRKTSFHTTRDTILEVNKLSLINKEFPQFKLVSELSFSLSKGEILGIFGLLGAGRTELLECMYGLHPKYSNGNIYVCGKKYNYRSPGDAIKAGIGLVPEDRTKDGLVLGLDVKTNISLSSLKSLEKFGVLNTRKERMLANDFIDKLSIKTPSSEQTAGNLSGGNQQKIILAKWLATNPIILLLDEPTRGIDINAKNEIYKLITKLASEGLGIIMVSSELPEILAISDRILLMSEGELTAEFIAKEATEEKIMEAAIPQTVK